MVIGSTFWSGNYIDRMINVWVHVFRQELVSSTMDAQLDQNIGLVESGYLNRHPLFMKRIGSHSNDQYLLISKCILYLQ